MFSHGSSLFLSDFINNQQHMLSVLFLFFVANPVKYFSTFYPFTQSSLYFSMFSIIFLICISFDFALIFITSFLLPLVYFSFSCFLSHGVVPFKLSFLMWIFVAISPTFRTVLAASHISHIVHQYLFQCLFCLPFPSLSWVHCAISRYLCVFWSSFSC